MMEISHKPMMLFNTILHTWGPTENKTNTWLFKGMGWSLDFVVCLFFAFLVVLSFFLIHLSSAPIVSISVARFSHAGYLCSQWLEHQQSGYPFALGQKVDHGQLWWSGGCISNLTWQVLRVSNNPVQMGWSYTPGIQGQEGRPSVRPPQPYNGELRFRISCFEDVAAFILALSIHHSPGPWQDAFRLVLGLQGLRTQSWCLFWITHCAKCCVRGFSFNPHSTPPLLLPLDSSGHTLVWLSNVHAIICVTERQWL
jgi:hypothetical protein